MRHRRQAPAGGHSTGSGFRKDIEGLRAVAVGLVILDHLVTRPGGGFIGVDVFFVVSGFLITGLLVAEVERTGRLSLRGFYARRARRILPAALTVLAAVVITAHLVFRGARVAQTVTDAKWALGFAANIHFSRVGTDYFQANRAPSLVQHFWSLAVEEQFYLVWPLVVLIVLCLLGRWLPRRTVRLLLLGAVTVATCASFAWALRQTARFPNAVYFSSPDRAWELGAGAIVAVGTACFPGIGGRLGRARGPLSLLGLAGIVLSAVVVPTAPGFPAPWAALPVLSTVLVIVAGVGGPVGQWGIALTNPLSRYVGRISYSLYLWHWPVIVVAETYIRDDAARMRYAIALAVMTGLSIASYHFIERPLRAMRFRRSTPRPRSRSWVAGAVRPAIATLTCLATALVLCALLPPKPLPSFNASAAGAPRKLRPAGSDVAQPGEHLAKAIDAALTARHFPDFDPPVDQLGNPRQRWGACDGATAATLARCTFGSSQPDAQVAVVVGDSEAMSWLPGISAALSGDGWRIYGLTLEACPATDVPVVDPRGHYYNSCDKHRRWVDQQVPRLDPDLVIVAETDGTLGRLADRATGVQAAKEYSAALQRTLRKLSANSTRPVVTLAPPPDVPDLTTCNHAGSTPADCVAPVKAGWVVFAALQRSAASATGTVYRDTHRWFCNAAGFCPVFVGKTLVRWDGQHVTDVYARSLAPQIHQVVSTTMHARH